LAVLVAGCTSTTSRGGLAPTTNQIATAPFTSSGSQPGPAGSATPPFEVAQASVEISGSSVTIKFAGRVVTGQLRTTGAAFTDGHRRLAFSVTGVTYTGGEVSASGSADDLVSTVTVSRSTSGATIRIDLRRPGTNHHFTVAHHQVGVEIS